MRQRGVRVALLQLLRFTQHTVPPHPSPLSLSSQCSRSTRLVSTFTSSQLSASPSELLASPSELSASPSELLASPSELLASPSELSASPSEAHPLLHRQQVERTGLMARSPRLTPLCCVMGCLGCRTPAVQEQRVGLHARHLHHRPHRHREEQRLARGQLACDTPPPSVSGCGDAAHDVMLPCHEGL
jgi:hypothetical protein